MGRERGYRRTFVLLGAGAFSALLIILGLGPAASIPLRSALRHLDPDASFASAGFANGVVVLRDLDLPGRGLSFDNIVLYWSGSLLNPSLDSVLAEDGIWVPAADHEGGSGRSSSSEMPPCRFSGLRICSGSDTSMVSGRIVTSSGRRSVSLFMDGDWGSMTGSVFMTGESDSAFIDWFSCSRIPGDLLPVPDLLANVRLEGSITVVRTDHVHASGEIVSVNGDPSRITFSLDDSSGHPTAIISSRLHELKEVLVSQACGLLGGACIDMEPSGNFTVVLGESDTVGVAVDALLQDVRMYSPGLAQDTLVFDAALEFEGSLCRESREVWIDSGLVTVGDFPVHFNLRCSFPDEPRLEILLWNHSVDGLILSRSVPEALMGDLSGLQLSGEGSFQVLLVLDWNCPDSSDFRADIDVRGLSVDRSPISVGQLRYGGSCLMRDSWGGRCTIWLDTLRNPGFVVFDSLHPCFEGLLRCAEDATFRSHDGFCEYHIRNSIRANMASGRFTRGGSTISMQLARNLFLNREKTLARKVQEVFLTWRLECYLSKDRILEIYANIVELGPGVFGFDQASRYYFNRDLDRLSTRQVAYLVSILPGPRLYHGFFSRGRVPDYWEDYLDRLIRISSERGWIDRDSALSALSDSIVFPEPSGAF